MPESSFSCWVQGKAGALKNSIIPGSRTTTMSWSSPTSNPSHLWFFGEHSGECPADSKWQDLYNTGQQDMQNESQLGSNVNGVAETRDNAQAAPRSKAVWTKGYIVWLTVSYYSFSFPFSLLSLSYCHFPFSFILFGAEALQKQRVDKKGQGD